MKDRLTIIRQLDKIADYIYQVPYDELTDYLKGIRDMINLLNGEEGNREGEFLSDFVFAEMNKICDDLELPF